MRLLLSPHLITAEKPLIEVFLILDNDYIYHDKTML